MLSCMFPVGIVPDAKKCGVSEVVIFICVHGLGAGYVSMHPSHSPLHPLCSWYGPRLVFTITVIDPINVRKVTLFTDT